MSVAISYYLQNSGIYNTVFCTQYLTQLGLGRSAPCIQYSPSLDWKLTHDHFQKPFFYGQENTLQLVENMIFVTQTTLQRTGLQCAYNRCSRWPPSARIWYTV